MESGLAHLATRLARWIADTGRTTAGWTAAIVRILMYGHDSPPAARASRVGARPPDPDSPPDVAVQGFGRSQGSTEAGLSDAKTCVDAIRDLPDADLFSALLHTVGTKTAVDAAAMRCMVRGPFLAVL